ncbi:PKD domain-containing protein [Anditalea andensis]|uniref:PKD domain-containing protein n=1 Tax=Anditalea andensis TaxID=1048983 RepID=A0A074KUX4_9BACT|nr:PKD domain-containing protein [Anditalea andensis]KEO72689.1 hypothetical protein EL17_18305 [Anditalea andensis]
MSTITKPQKKIPALMLGLTMLLGACVGSENELVLPEPPVMAASVNATDILAGESIVFTDNSTKVYQRSWSFTGGEPATSEEQEVTVMYARGGTYLASLSLTYIDNRVETKEFTIEVEGPEEPEVPTLAFYSENPNHDETAAIKWQRNNQFTISEISSGTYEGAKALSFTTDGSSDWAMATITPESGTVDLSEFAAGAYNFAIRSTSTGTLDIRLQSAGNNAVIRFTASDEQYGFKRDGEWHKVSIPLADFKANRPGLNLAAINALMVLRSDGDVRTANNYDFYIDDFYVSMPIPE